MQDRDDLSDWFVEAGQMHKVYSHSFCNISAAGAEDSSKGLFFDRDPRISDSSTVSLCVEGLELVDASSESHVDCILVDYGFWNNGVSKCPLNTRGWVLQERLLSPRVLHFGRDQLFWECREHAAAECYPDSLPRLLHNSEPVNFKKFDRKLRGKDLETHKIEAVDDEGAFFHYQVWNSIVQAYSSTRLTKGSDKLIALSGVAKYFVEPIGDQYVVGMWRKHLACSLLWHVDSKSQVDGSPSARPSLYCAPSFSWTAVDGVVSTTKPTTRKSLFEIIDVKIDYLSSDPTSLVSGGYIELKGVLRSRPCGSLSSCLCRSMVALSRTQRSHTGRWAHWYILMLGKKASMRRMKRRRCIICQPRNRKETVSICHIYC